MICDECGAERKEGEISYSPIQIIQGTPLGWYQGSDGTLCPQHLSESFQNTN